MASIHLHTIDEVAVDRDTTEEPFPVTIRLTDEDGDTVRFRLQGMSPSATEEFRDQIADLHRRLDALLDEWEDQPDWDNDGFILPPHDYDHRGWCVRFEGKDVADRVPDRTVAMFLLAEAMTKAGHFPNVWETGRDWAPQPIDDEVRAFHDEGGTDLIPLEGVQYDAGSGVELRDGEHWGYVTVVRDLGQHGVCLDVYGAPPVIVTDRDTIRPYDEEGDA